MDAIQLIGLLVTGALVPLVGYVLRRLYKQDRDNEKKAQRDAAEHESTRRERDVLVTRVADLEAKVRDLEPLKKQVAVLTTQLEETQKRLDDAEERDANKQAEIDRLNGIVDERTKETIALTIERDQLKVANATYERALTLLGIERMERHAASAEPPEPGEPKDAAAEQAGDEAKE